GGVGGGIQRLEAREDRDGDGAVDLRGPLIGGELERVQTLLAEGRARVATDGSHRRRIVEADSGRVVVDDHDVGVGQGGRGRCEQRGDEGEAAHYLSSAAGAGLLAVRSLRGVQVVVTVPSAFLTATASTR